jgi:hypothetical protein
MLVVTSFLMIGIESVSGFAAEANNQHIRASSVKREFFFKFKTL